MSGRAIITIRSKQWEVSLATTPWEMAQGLGGIPGILSQTGILFDTGWEQIIQVTTVPMLFPLDIAFLSGSLVVTEVYRGVDPGYLVTSEHPARYWLEVNAGELESIDTGDRASLELVALDMVPDWLSAMTSLMTFMVLGAFVVTVVRMLTKQMLGKPEEEKYLPQTKAKGKFVIERDYIGSIIIAKPDQPSKSVYLQFEADKSLIYDILKKSEKKDLDAGWSIEIKDTEPRASILQELWEGAGTQPQVLPQVIEGGEPIPPEFHYLIGWVQEPLPEYSLLTALPAVEVVERKIDTVLKQLKDGVETIQESDKFRLFLTTMSKFHDYSIGNQILIMLQRPDATRVAGFNTWKDLGRWVKKGEKGIAILAPVLPPRPTCPECGARVPKGARFCPECGASVEEVEIEVVPHYFKVVYVFDISQTEGKPLPEFEVPVLTGEVNEALFAKVMTLAKAQGLEVSFESRPYQDPAIKGQYLAPNRIWIRPEESRAQQLKSLLHEVDHYYSEGVFHIPRRDAETIAESAAFVVGAHYGFDTGVRSFPYVALWAQDKKVLEQNLGAIRRVATTMLGELERIGTSLGMSTLGKPAEFMPEPKPLPKRAYVHLTFRAIGGRPRTVWAYKTGKTSYRVVDTSGDEKDEIVIVHPSDIIREIPARMNLKYAELEEETQPRDTEEVSPRERRKPPVESLVCHSCGSIIFRTGEKYYDTPVGIYCFHCVPRIYRTAEYEKIYYPGKAMEARLPRLIGPTRRDKEPPPEELEFFADSPDHIDQSMDRNGLRPKLDAVFQKAIARAKGAR